MNLLYVYSTGLFLCWFLMPLTPSSWKRDKKKGGELIWAAFFLWPIMVPLMLGEIVGEATGWIKNGKRKKR